jgi:hypothetical protein
LDFETPLTREMPDESAASADWMAEQGERTAEESLDGEGSASPSAFDDSVVTVPEVASLAFRYYDGKGWSGSWNSLQKKSLPVAIEVTFTVRMEEPGRGETDTGPGADSPPGEALPVGVAASGAAEDVHRLVVELPGSPSYQKQPEVERKPPRAVKRPPPVRRIVPRRWQPPRRPKPQGRGPDQWMRTSQP